MCVVVICIQSLTDVPLVVGANREEAYARGGTMPAIQSGPIPFVAGLDPIAGGTWLGINAAGVLVAVTNRKKQQLPPTPRSRGLLVRDLLASKTAVAAIERASRELAAGQYAGCNLICADVVDGFVIEAGDTPRLRTLEPGPHVITTGDLDDSDDPRIRFGLECLTPIPDSLDDLLALLHRYLATRDGPTPVCLHDGERGTVSSTIVALSIDPERRRFMHAQGSPDRVPHVDRSELFARFEAKDVGST